MERTLYMDSILPEHIHLANCLGLEMSITTACISGNCPGFLEVTVTGESKSIKEFELNPVVESHESEW
ncbi:hypothetical protein fHeYen901_225 [Yersinia phage fHe-Yen9-01]|uniref:Uncharacterized protein n=1 Tax=Yersinia phage fHe-Yen9-01 TaxID=1965363 RepID=A0A1V0DXY1_9CAUD|nr:hypothetical protein KNT60_gp224 [Yersinia phage fHe-Yen9-01]ARB05998.1 hypothetical protein fHeYen901_225 [Yersinia phage fHe-Yen9-01]